MSNFPPRLFAIIPAAGRSRRMGRPKLLLPFGETTVIGQLLRTLAAVEVATFVLLRPDDEELRDEVEKATATIVQPDEPPPEMRISVEHLLRAVERTHLPNSVDGWLLIPADHPLLSPDTLQRLIETWRTNVESIVLPTHNSLRGHPTIFPWKLAAAVAEFPENVGVNQLLHDHPTEILEVAVDDPTVTFDLDTPDDYERALRLC